MSGSASAQLTVIATGNNTYQYNITLKDTGGTPIGTFWFGWNASPDEDLLPIMPTSVLTPTPGWTETVTHTGTGDGYGIQWVTTTAASDLIGGSSLSGFQFTSTISPLTMLSQSTIDPTYPTTESFAYSAGPFSSTPSIFSAVGAVTPQTVTSAYAAILRTQPTTAALGAGVNAIATGQETLLQYETGLIGSEQTLYTTLPALVTIDAYYNATPPSSSALDEEAAATASPVQIGFYAAQYLHNLGYSDANVWTIMASQWGADQHSQFYQTYNGFGTDYPDFISAVYKREFGFAPSAVNLQNLIADVPGVQNLLGGGTGGPTPIQIVSGIYGYLLYVGQTTPTLTTQYGTSADEFLQAAANGTVNYGEELNQQFPPSASVVTGVTTGTTSHALADPNVITVTTPDQLIDPGAGGFTIQFQPGSGGDTLMLHAAGTDQLSGFDPASDVLDVRALVAGTGLALTGDLAALAGYLTVADQGGDALLRFDPAGHGGGSTVAVLQGLGSSVTGLDQLIALGTVRLS